MAMDRDMERKDSSIRLQYQPIGIIHTEFRDKKDAPIQGVFAKGTNKLSRK